MADDSAPSPWSRAAADDRTDSPVEITLEAAPGSAHHEEDVDVDGSSGDVHRRTSVTVGTTIVAVLVAAVIGFTIGQVTARESSDAPAAADPAPADTRPGVATDTVEEPATAEPRRRGDFIVVPPEFDGLDLVGLTTDGEVLRIDGRTGDAVLWPITDESPGRAAHQHSRSQDGLRTPRAVHLGDRIAIVDPLGRSNYILDERAVATPVTDDLVGAIAFHPTADPDEIYALYPTSVPDQLIIRRTGVDNPQSSGSILTTAQFAVADHHGGLYVQTADGVHHFDGNRLTLIAPGELLGTGHHHILTRHCGDEPGCEPALHDRRTGTHVYLELPDDTTFSLATTQPHRISPDGRHLVGHQRTRYTPTIINLDTGDSIEHAGFPDALTDHAWTPGGHLLYIVGDILYLHDPTTSTTRALDSFPPLSNIDVRTTP